MDRRHEPLGDLGQRRRRGDRQAELLVQYPTSPAGYCNVGTYTFKYIRSMHSTSKVTCSATTSDTLAGNLMMGPG